ncbi:MULTISPECIES: hypothetical protein [Sphingobacterium]|uniref:Uncharacterized protein n=1 Tax=Sphingobacterium zeae TaxID=1776859 RepID=A0ABU0U7D2_9SPHI|nr:MULTISPECIES: hypothetical protein [Sphingobacterium]MDQ1150877.1 hypothetical protein [Sphingobacterium zeae]MDR6736605.1 hypothetical protein [Sphingobacterium sp. 2149]
MDKGRQREEKSCIWLEKGNFYGMGDVDKDNQFSDIMDVKESLDRYNGNHYMAQLILSYASKYPNKIIKIVQ